MKPKFKSRYRGENDYFWNGHRYHCLTRAENWSNFWNYTPEEYLAQRVALVGTVYGGADNTQFPPKELMVHFPGYVAARFRFQEDVVIVEYDGAAPQTVWSPLYGTLSLEEARSLREMNIDLGIPDPEEILRLQDDGCPLAVA